MRKHRILLSVVILTLLVLAALGLFACRHVPTPTPKEGVVMPVATAMNKVYASMIAADGSKKVNYFTLTCDGSYVDGETVYDYTFAGAFDITRNNRDDDKRTELSFTVKQGNTEKFLLHYSEGKIYLDFPPYARRAVISDFNLAEAVHRIYAQKETGIVKEVADTLPMIAGRIFSGCRYYADGGTERYVFTLSYEMLFEAFSSLVTSWNAGFTPTELLSALHISDAKATSLVENGKATTVEFSVKDGAFLSAKASVENEGSFLLDHFSLTSGTAALTIPDGLASYTEYDFRNFALSGTLYLTADNKDSDRAVNYGVTVARAFDAVTYPFTYDFRSHYVAGSGLEFDLALTDKNGKDSHFTVKGEYLYVDLVSYGIQKFKMKTSDLSAKLGAAGFKDVDEYTFKDRLRLLALLMASRTEEDDVVTYRPSEAFFNLLAEKLGFKGLFGVTGAKVSWSKANDRLQSLSASLSVGAMTGSISASTFTFGATAAIAEPTDASEYYDLTTRDVTHISARGTMAEHTPVPSDGHYLSALLTSLSGEEITFEAEGGISYTADFVYGNTGAMKRFFARLYNARGNEIVNLYFTEDTQGVFYLIYPEKSGVRKVRTLTLAEDPLAYFNEAIRVEESAVSRKVYLAAHENSFTIGAQPPMISFIEERLAAIYPDIALPMLRSLKCRRYELRISGDGLTGVVVYDSESDLTITASSFNVTFGDDWDLTSLTANTPEKVALLADNDMPEVATATFTGGLTYRVALEDYVTGEKTWQYAGVPDHVGSEGQETTVTATTTLLGKSISARIGVDLSPVSTIDLSGSRTYATKFDANTKTFHFTLYNDVSPKTVLDTFSLMTATVRDIDYVKDVTWDLSGLTTTLDKKTFTVKPKVKTYFGNSIFLGGIANFFVEIEGEKARSTDYSLTFVAYDGRDPLNAAVYSDVLNVTTRDDQRLTAEHVTWDLTNSNIESMAKAGTLYAYTTADPARPDKVRAKVYDLTGNYVVLEVPIYFRAKVVETASFDTSSLEGVTYDAANKKFIFDVLKVRGLAATAADKILPTSLVANEGETTEFAMKGVKWEYDAVESVANASGATGTLYLVVGDSISGYQRMTFGYEFTKAEIVKTALLDEDGATILEKTEDMYAYSFDHLNAYTYSHPVSVRVTYRVGEGTNTEDLSIKWNYDRPFRETDLCQGGAYLLTGAVGSEPLTVGLSFDQKLITSYRFEAAQLRSEGGEDILLSEKQGRSCLTYSVLAAISDASGLDYTSKGNYPAKMMIAFNGGSSYVEAAVEWDLSALDDKTDIIGSGYFGTVRAIAKGQVVDVYVYVAPAVGDYDTVYVDAAMTEQKITFRLMTPDEGDFKVTDPRDVANYPEKLFVLNGATNEEYDVTVLSWQGIEEISRLYTAQLSSGKKANEVKGEAVVTAKIGSGTVGYKEIRLNVAVVASEISEIRVSGLPYAASSELTGGSTPYAITPDYTAGTHGTFSYDLSLAINPYYVNPKAPESYPAYVNFKLDGVDVRTKAAWDLTRVPADAALTGNTTRYAGVDGVFGFPVYAMIDLGENFPNVSVGAEVNVLKRAIDKVWINDSSQPYIDVDGYSAAPFGTDVLGDEVTIDVKVQFKGDANKYPLKLKYDKSDIVLSFDGSGLYEGIDVRVGNENGGYQTLSGYGIRVFSNIVSRITLASEDRLAGTDGVFFVATYESAGSDKLVYSYYHVMDMGKALPEKITVTFGMDGAARVVYRAGTAGAAAGGVVFEWVRNAENHIGVELWNPSVPTSVGGVRQRIYNSEQSDYNLPQFSMFFDDDPWSEVYRDIADEEKYITVRSALAHYAEYISADDIDETHQVRTITADEDNAVALGEDTRLSVGTYRLYVEVVGHNHYAGKVYKTFTITPKDITDSIVLVVNGARRDDGASANYTGEAYIVTAGSGDYPIEVPLLVNGQPSVAVTDVRYDSVHTTEEAYYAFIVGVAPEAQNYTISFKALTFKILDIPFVNPQEDISVHMRWVAARSEFDATVMVAGDYLARDPDLTNGYIIRYYEQEDSLDEVTTFVAGRMYYYTVEIKIPNHTKYVKRDRISAK